MKFYCNPAELSDALVVVSKALSLKASIPILEGIRILAEGTTLTLSCTDLELFIEKKINADIKLEGETVVLGKFFTEFVKKLTSLESIELEKIGNKLVIKYGQNETEIQCLNEDTFPSMNTVGDEKSFYIKENDLKEVLERTLFCVAVEDSRPILKGCLLEIENNELTAVALDGYRLAISKTSVSEQNGNINIVVPGKILNEVLKVLEGGETEIKVNVQKNNIMFDKGHTIIITRLFEGEFIQYKKVIPSKSSTLIEVNKGTFEDGLDRASIIVRNKKNNYLRLSLRKEAIVIKTNSEFGSIRENIDCKLEGEELDIAFNSKYLFDALNKIKEDFIRIEFSNSNAPAVILPMEGERFKYIILPVRLVG